MRIGSLCSGYGGLDRAVEELTGGEVVWVSDVDKGANKILAHRYSTVPNLGDFTVMDWSTVTPIDVLTAGYPCQPFSHAGKREGTNDARHLWPEVLRCLTELRPPFALFENVRGHLSLGFDQVLADLATHDYDARWIVLRAADIGAPHGRARLFILASDARRGGDRWDLVGAGRGSVRISGVRGEDPHGGGDEGGADLRGGMTLMPTPTVDDSSNISRSSGEFQSLTRTVTLLPTPNTGESASGHGRRGGKPGNGSQSGASLDQIASLLPTPTARDGKDGQIRREPHRPDDVDTLSRALTDVPCAGPLLPTPAVNDMGASYTPDEWDAWTDRMKAEHGNGNGHGKSLSIEAQRLLPTPEASDGSGGRKSTELGGFRGSGAKRAITLATAVDHALLPTPTTTQRGPDANLDTREGARANLHNILLEGQGRMERPHDTSQWGDYAPAIARWEAVLGRPAPAPTMTSSKGNQQLSPRFVEWMMGLREGWVDDVPGLTRNEKLKALGNGVVSQQAIEAVLRLLALGERAIA